jgi:hypothetical protein
MNLRGSVVAPFLFRARPLWRFDRRSNGRAEIRGEPDASWSRVLGRCHEISLENWRPFLNGACTIPCVMFANLDGGAGTTYSAGLRQTGGTTELIGMQFQPDPCCFTRFEYRARLVTIVRGGVEPVTARCARPTVVWVDS